MGDNVKRKKFGGYELCLEISHITSEQETVISLRAVYRKLASNGNKTKKISRSDVPARPLAIFDMFQEEVYWDYVEGLD